MFSYVRVPEFAKVLVPIVGSTDPQGARAAPTKWTKTSVFPRSVRLTPTGSVEYPSPELGYTQVLSKRPLTANSLTTQSVRTPTGNVCHQAPDRHHRRSLGPRYDMSLDVRFSRSERLLSSRFTVAEGSTADSSPRFARGDRFRVRPPSHLDSCAPDPPTSA
jgi:hypothetical protein